MSDTCLTFPTKVPVAWALAHAEALSFEKRGLKPTLLRLLSETSWLLTVRKLGQNREPGETEARSAGKQLAEG